MIVSHSERDRAAIHADVPVKAESPVALRQVGANKSTMSKNINPALA